MMLRHHLFIGVPPLLVHAIAALALASCEATAPVAPVPVQTVIQLKPAPKLEVVVDIRPHSMWTSARIDKAREAARVLERVINSDAFARVLTQRTDLQHTAGLDSTQLLRVIRSGLPLDALRQGAPKSAPRIALALAISPERGEFSGYDGFTDLGTGIIYAQRAWFDRADVCHLAGLYAHEHMHVLGFTHTTYPHPWRGKSVPYAIGDMIADLARAEDSAACR